MDLNRSVMLSIPRYVCLCALLLVLSCNKATQIRFSETNISTKNNRIVEVNIPQANGASAVAKAMNSEIRKTVTTALHTGNPDGAMLTSVEEGIERFNAEYLQFKRDFPETEIQYEAQIDGEVLYQSPEMICVALTSYTNTGGAHGLYNVSFLNFDVSTGKKVSNQQLITDAEGFKKKARPYFDEAVAEKGGDALFDAENFQLPANIGYTENGLVLLYNTYEIAPYSTGIIEFRIPYGEVAPYLAFNHF